MSHRPGKQLQLRLSGIKPGGNKFRTFYRFRLLICYIFQGTYWYHSHFLNQYCDGLRGAMVIYDPDDPHSGLYDVDDGEREIQG